jgi:hypothetical protein
MGLRSSAASVRGDAGEPASPRSTFRESASRSRRVSVLLPFRRGSDAAVRPRGFLVPRSRATMAVGVLSDHVEGQR